MNAKAEQEGTVLATCHSTLTLHLVSRVNDEASTAQTLHTAPEYHHTTAFSILTPAKFHEVTDLLLTQPNLNSSHLFRADILRDSGGLLRTKEELEADAGFGGPERAVKAGKDVRADGQRTGGDEGDGGRQSDGTDDLQSRQWCGGDITLNGVAPHRTVIRRLIPRNQNLDRPLEQTCCLFKLEGGREAVVYLPHVDDAKAMPWYHPTLKALAYVYEPAEELEGSDAAVTVYYLPFDADGNGDNVEELPERLHRTLLALGRTFLRLARYQAPTSDTNSGMKGNAVLPRGRSATTAEQDGSILTDQRDIDLRPAYLKTTLLPQHLTQDTYTMLKTRHAPYLIASWAEATPAEKHVFEDLSIAAFLIELWKKMYGGPGNFPGFVDLACGNGVLVWVLNKEGWKGKGVDVRRRKSWASLALEEDRKVEEALIIPKPFEDVLRDDKMDDDGNDRAVELSELRTKSHNGIFPPGTFIISNHADELTIWTPLLAALSCPETPLPFLAIPCCSHALSGEKWRYSPKDAAVWKTLEAVENASASVEYDNTQTGEDGSIRASQGVRAVQDGSVEQQKADGPETGDLRAMRALKQKERQREPTESIARGTAVDKSMYGCLTRKTVQVARQLGIDTTCTLMRIPSTRNVGIVSFRDALSEEGHDCQRESVAMQSGHASWRVNAIEQIVERECARTGGVQGSAAIWVERARKLHVGQGRGKVNWGSKPDCQVYDGGDVRPAEVGSQSEQVQAD